jgi:hypothetical protein
MRLLAWPCGDHTKCRRPCIALATSCRIVLCGCFWPSLELERKEIFGRLKTRQQRARAGRAARAGGQRSRRKARGCWWGHGRSELLLRKGTCHRTATMRRCASSPRGPRATPACTLFSDAPDRSFCFCLSPSICKN